ncbi:MAG: fimbrillin family protein [Bacteroidales bacterium]|nr:fimbrillin family protein [Bacteroidales bacterium]
MKKVLIFVAFAAALAACGKNQVPTWTNPDQQAVTPDGQVYDVRILPVMTKVTDTAFENGDAIGVSISRTAGAYATNEKLTYNGSEFSGSLKWYAEGTEGASVSAYYPYAATVPASFSVQADQSAGTSASDFVAGAKTGVLPSASPVVVPFKHKLTKIILNITKNVDGDLGAVKLGGARLAANLDADFNASVDASAAEGTITAFKKDAATYCLILPPQTVALVATVVTTGDNELSQILEETALLGGKQYTINMIVNPSDLKVTFSGDIEDWEDGGSLGADNTLIEKLSDGYITYHEAKYTVAKMKDGKWWMTQNLRYVPEGITVDGTLDGKTVTKVDAGIYYPVVVNAENTQAVFSKDVEVIAARGYLYQAEVALGLSVGAITSVAQAEALEGAQGLCPKGWHVPTGADIIGLVGKAVSPLTNDTTAPYYDGSNGSIALLNADGFNMDAFGAVSIQDNTKTSGTLMGWATGYPDKISSGMFIGSTYGGVTYNTSGDETSGIKNLQFMGLMPMTNKASEDAYTCNGTKVSYRIAGPLRCVRNN